MLYAAYMRVYINIYILTFHSAADYLARRKAYTFNDSGRIFT